MESWGLNQQPSLSSPLQALPLLQAHTTHRAHDTVLHIALNSRAVLSHVTRGRGTGAWRVCMLLNVGGSLATLTHVLTED